MQYPFIYLASASPRRQELLRQLGVQYKMLLPGESEDAEALEHVRSGETPGRYVRRVTLTKVAAAQTRRMARDLPDAPVLCADTTVALGSEILGKPQSKADAARMLQCLSGERHRVLTCVAVASGTQVWDVTQISHVRFAPLSPRDIAHYVAGGEPFGKAGAYAIQGSAAAFVEHISGSYTGIMGLPLFETAALLKQARVKL
jgi:septum formation protein